MSREHVTMCVCVSRREKETVAGGVETQNRRTWPCVSNHTHAFAVQPPRSPTPPRIQYNYKRTNESEKKGKCIRFDYVGGGCHA